MNTPFLNLSFLLTPLENRSLLQASGVGNNTTDESIVNATESHHKAHDASMLMEASSSSSPSDSTVAGASHLDLDKGLLTNSENINQCTFKQGNTAVQENTGPNNTRLVGFLADDGTYVNGWNFVANALRLVKIVGNYDSPFLDFISNGGLYLTGDLLLAFALFEDALGVYLNTEHALGELSGQSDATAIDHYQLQNQLNQQLTDVIIGGGWVFIDAATALTLPFFAGYLPKKFVNYLVKSIYLGCMANFGHGFYNKLSSLWTHDTLQNEALDMGETFALTKHMLQEHQHVHPGVNIPEPLMEKAEFYKQFSEHVSASQSPMSYLIPTIQAGLKNYSMGQGLYNFVSGVDSKMSKVLASGSMLLATGLYILNTQFGPFFNQPSHVSTDDIGRFLNDLANEYGSESRGSATITCEKLVDGASVDLQICDLLAREGDHPDSVELFRNVFHV